MTIKQHVWISLDGSETPVEQLDTQHLINAIECIERDDPRYSAKHGVALPAMWAEIIRRAKACDVAANRFVWAKHGVGPALAGLSLDPGFVTGIAWFDRCARPARSSTESSVGSGGGVRPDSADGRVTLPRRRLDKIDATLRELEANPTNMVKRRLDALERVAHAPVPVVDQSTFDALALRVTQLEHRLAFGALAKAKTKAKPGTRNTPKRGKARAK